MSSKKDNFKLSNRKLMKLAIRLASNQKYLTGINPSVGCVITNNNKILSYGVTGFNGKPHAEVTTIKKLKKFNLKNIVHPAHQMVHVLFISSLLYSFIGCAPKDKQSKAKLNIVSSLVMNNLNMNGGAVIYGQRTDAAGNWGRIFLPGDDFVVEMMTGVAW